MPRQPGGERLAVLIDARALSGRLDGTRTHLVELIAALARTDRLTLSVLLPAAPDPESERILSSLEGAELLPGDGRPVAGRLAVVHRPYQMSTPAELGTLAGFGRRLVITHQDLIGFREPAYFASPEAWRSHRRLTRRALAAADAVVFPSEHVRAEAIEAELVETGRAHTVPLGVDHRTAAEASPAVPEGLDLGADEELIVCLGSDLRHKNRLFALEVTRQLQQRHGWGGRLVLAGPRMEFGSSWSEEDAVLAGDRRLGAAVARLEQVTDGERRWLLERARLVLYPSLDEGFGLIPFEAARHGVPCLWSATTSLAEVLPPEAAGMVLGDAAATGERAFELLGDGTARAANLEAVRARAECYRWDECAARLIALYEHVAAAPGSPGGALERESGVMQDGLSEDALRLVGPGGMLPTEAERPLLALASHRRLARPVLAALKVGYTISRRWRERRPRAGG